VAEGDMQVHGNYHVKITEGVPGASDLVFRSFSPPTISFDASQTKVWDGKGNPVKATGTNRQVTYGPCSFERGVDKSKAFRELVKATKEKGITPETKLNMTVEVLTGDEEILTTWNLKGAVVQSYDPPSFSAEDTGILYEKLTFTVEEAEEV
jgi:phage tail-like protein